MNTAAAFANAPHIRPDSATCVRWNPDKRRFELVVNHQVLATVSRFGMTVPGSRKKFADEVQKQIRLRAIDDAVERAYGDEG